MDVTYPAGAIPVSPARFYHDADRGAGYTEVPVAVDSTGAHADTTGMTGRYFPTLLYTTTGDAQVRTVDLPEVYLPVDPRLVVAPEYVARRARPPLPLPLSEDDRETIIDAILDAQADVVAYLGQPITPTTRTATGVYPYADGWHLPEDDAVVVSVTAETDDENTPTGYYTLTYTTGLDAANDPDLRPIRRYVLAHAMNSSAFTDLWRASTGAKGEVKSLSAEGQSVSFAAATLGGGGDAGSGKPGSMPTLASLDLWRVAGRRVYQAPSLVTQFPYESMGW
jgi:hypothetical protein